VGRNTNRGGQPDDEARQQLPGGRSRLVVLAEEVAPQRGREHGGAVRGDEQERGEQKATETHHTLPSRIRLERMFHIGNQRRRLPVLVIVLAAAASLAGRCGVAAGVWGDQRPAVDLATGAEAGAKASVSSGAYDRFTTHRRTVARATCA